MDQKRVVNAPRCSVIGGEKVPLAAGGQEALCAEIGKALANVGRADAANVAVHVRRSQLSAIVKLADGRTLPEVGITVSDAPLSGKIIKSFALQIATAIRETNN